MLMPRSFRGKTIPAELKSEKDALSNKVRAIEDRLFGFKCRAGLEDKAAAINTAIDALNSELTAAGIPSGMQMRKIEF